MVSTLDIPVELRQADSLFSTDISTRWFVLHTRSRQEKALVQDIEIRGISCFVPLVRRARYYGRRKLVVDQPLFPGYVFLRGKIEDAYVADRTGRIASILPVADQSKFNWELANIWQALRVPEGVPLDAYPYLKVGIRAEVRSGPFRGVQGIVARRDRPDRLLLQVGMLGQAIGLELDGALVEALD